MEIPGTRSGIELNELNKELVIFFQEIYKGA